MSTLLVGQTSVQEANKSGLILASLAVSLLASLLFGILYTAIAHMGSLELGGVMRSSAGIACFIFGCGIAGFGMVLNNAFVGLLRSSLQMYQNAIFSTLKIALLVLVVAQLGSVAGEGIIVATWVLAQAVSVIAFTMILMRLISHGGHLPNISLLRPHLRSVLGHHLLDLVTQTPVLVMPFLVTIALSPTVNAAFNVAWMMLRITFLVPAALVTVLFAVGTSDPGAFIARMRMSLILSTASGVAAALLFFFFSDIILAFFNPAYPGIAAHSLSLLGISLLGVAVRGHYLAIKRLRHEMVAASRFLAFAGLLDLLFALVGSRLGGLLGLTVGWTLAVFVEAALMLPVVMQAADLPIPRIFVPAARGFRFAPAGAGGSGSRSTAARSHAPRGK
ncbi:MAG: hypothetical protein ACHQAY_13070 [Hyphomicrobiales bacterium]